VVASAVTNSNGQYSAGPLYEAADRYQVSAKKRGYHLSNAGTSASSGNFRAEKLAEIVVKIQPPAGQSTPVAGEGLSLAFLVVPCFCCFCPPV
jgi:autotransporter translocation and assembly factor TamB